MGINLLQGIAALLYYKTPILKEDKQTTVQFEDLLPTEQKPYADQAQEMLMILDKLNFTPRPKQEISDAEGIKRLLDIIKNFLASQEIDPAMTNWDILARKIWNNEKT